MIPTGSASISQKIAPPNTSEAVTGAARSTTSLTSSRFTNDSPSDCSPTSCQRKRPVLLPDRLVEMEPFGDALHVLREAPWPAASRAGSAGVT